MVFRGVLNGFKKGNKTMSEATKQEPKKRSLSEILDEYQELMWRIDDQDGEITEDIYDELEAADAEVTTKINGCLLVREKLEAQAELFKTKAKRMSDYSKSLARRADWLKNYVHTAMHRMNIKKIENLDDFAWVQIRRTAPKLNIISEEDFTRRYWDKEEFVELDPKIRKHEVKAALRAGEKVEGAELIENEALYVK